MTQQVGICDDLSSVPELCVAGETHSLEPSSDLT